MKVTETISIVFSLLAVVSSFYAVWVSKKQNDQKVKIELLQETLKKLELAKELLSSSPESNDIASALYERWIRARKVVDDTSALFPEQAKRELRKQRQKLNDSYVRYLGEKHGLTWKEDTTELYSLNELPGKMSEFIGDVLEALDSEMDNIWCSLKQCME